MTVSGFMRDRLKYRYRSFSFGFFIISFTRALSHRRGKKRGMGLKLTSKNEMLNSGAQ